MNDNTIRIVIAGDLFPRYDTKDLSAGNAEKVFGAEIVQMFHSADISFFNLEGALTNSSTPIDKCGPVIKAPPSIVNGFAALGVTCVSLGNNHVMDYGKKGYEDTCAALDSKGILHFGSGENEDSIKTHLMFDVKGKRICLYSVADVVFNIPGKDYPGAHLYDEYQVCKDLEALKKSCDFLIVFYHGGTQFFRYPSQKLIRHFHRMADNGADVVIANHTHCIGAKEDYNGSFLLYGQGNFLFYKNRPVLGTTSLLLELLIDQDGKPEIKHYLTCHDGDRVWLDPNQDLSDFEERCRRLAEGDTFEAEFKAACDKKRTMFLRNMRGHSFEDRLMHKILPEAKYLEYLRKQYRSVDILRTIEVLRCEEINEVITQAMINYLEN